MQETPGQEERLWLQFKNGDKDAFAALYRQYSLPLIAYGFRLCPDKDVLKDRDYPRGEHLVQCIDVGSDAGDGPRCRAG